MTSNIGSNVDTQVNQTFKNFPNTYNLGTIVFKDERSELIYTRTDNNQKSLEVVSLTTGQRQQLDSYICPNDGVPFTEAQLEMMRTNLKNGSLSLQFPLKGGGSKASSLKSHDHPKEPTETKQADGKQVVCVDKSVFRHETYNNERRPSSSKTIVDDVQGDPKSVRVLAEKIKRKISEGKECATLIAKARYVIEAYKNSEKTFDLMLEYTHLAKCGNEEICRLMLEGLIEDLKDGGLKPHILITIRETLRYMDVALLTHNLINKLLVTLEDVCLEDGTGGKFIEDGHDSAVLSTIISTLVATLKVVVKNDVQNISYDATQKKLYNFFKRIAENKKKLWSRRIQEKATEGMQVSVRVQHDSSKRKQNLQIFVNVLKGILHVGAVVAKQDLLTLEKAYVNFENATYSQKEKEEWFDSLTALEEIIKVGGNEMREFFGKKFLELATKIKKEQAGHLLAGVIDILSHITSYSEDGQEQQEALKMLLGVFFTNDDTPTAKAFNALFKHLDDHDITLIRAELERQLVEWTGEGRTLGNLAQTNLINIRGFSPKYLSAHETLLDRGSINSLVSRSAPKMTRSTTLIGLALKREELVDKALEKIKADELDPKINKELERHRARFVLPNVMDENGVVMDGLHAYREAIKNHKMVIFKGPAGAGKTTLLNEIRFMTQEQYADDRNHFSVTIQLGRVNKSSANYLYDGCLKSGLTHLQAKKATSDIDMVFDIGMDASDEMEGDPKNVVSALPLNSISAKSKICLTHRDQALPVDDNTMLYFAPIVGGEVQKSQVKVFSVLPVDQAKAKEFFEKAIKSSIEKPVWEVDEYLKNMDEFGFFNEPITYLTLDMVFNALPKVAKDLKGKSIVEVKLALFQRYVKQKYYRETVKLAELGHSFPKDFEVDAEGFDKSAAELMDRENWTSLTPPVGSRFKKKVVNPDLENLFKLENAIYFRASFLQRIGGSFVFESEIIFRYILFRSQMDSLEQYFASGKDLLKDEHFNLKEITNETLLEFFYLEYKSNPKFKTFLEKLQNSESCKIAAKNSRNILNFKPKDKQESKEQEK